MPDVIKFAEAALYLGLGPQSEDQDISRGLRVPEMLSNSTITITGGTGSLALPADCLEWVKVMRDDSSLKLPYPASIKRVQEIRSGSWTSGTTERWYAATPQELLIAPIPTDDEDWILSYYQQPVAMTSNGTEPAFFDKYYSVYLTAGKWALAKFLGDAAMLADEERELARQMAIVTRKTRQRWGAVA